MFTNPLPSDQDYLVVFSEYAQRYYIKRFAKEYKGKRWELTQDSIFQELKRVHNLQSTQQVDQLKIGDRCILFKYDFAIAQSGISPKASGNRCIVFLDIAKRHQTVLVVYGKGDLPKNQHETRWCLEIAQKQFPELWRRLD